MRHFIFSLILSIGLTGVTQAQTVQPSDLSAILAEQGISGGLDHAAEQDEGPQKALCSARCIRWMRCNICCMCATIIIQDVCRWCLADARRCGVNPNAEFDPAFIEIGLTGALERLAKAERALADISEDEFALTIDLDDVWFDVDKDGVRALMNPWACLWPVFLMCSRRR